MSESFKYYSFNRFVDSFIIDSLNHLLNRVIESFTQLIHSETHIHSVTMHCCCFARSNYCTIFVGSAKINKIILCLKCKLDFLYSTLTITLLYCCVKSIAHMQSC